MNRVVCPLVGKSMRFLFPSDLAVLQTCSNQFLLFFPGPTSWLGCHVSLPGLGDNTAFFSDLQASASVSLPYLLNGRRGDPGASVQQASSSQGTQGPQPPQGKDWEGIEGHTGVQGFKMSPFNRALLKLGVSIELRKEIQAAHTLSFQLMRNPFLA